MSVPLFEDNLVFVPLYEENKMSVLHFDLKIIWCLSF